MGSWFSNLHVKKSSLATVAAIAECISQMMAERHFLPAESADDADESYALVTAPDSPWISVYSDAFEFDGPDAFEGLATPLSAQLQTDVLGIACFDSDYLFLNLIDTAGGVNAWASSGSAAGLGIKRRTGINAWKTKVADHPRFKDSVRQNYDFAEELLDEIAPCIQLPSERSAAAFETLAEFELDAAAHYLHFKLPPDAAGKEPPLLMPYLYSGKPCFLDEPHTVRALNCGGTSKGLTVYFVGPFVEHDEITFSDVTLAYGKMPIEHRPLKLEKFQLPNGQWAYRGHDPGFRIPPKIAPQLSMSKQFRLSMDRSFFVRFIPHGNPRKMLDISVFLIPDQNPEGQIGWNVWYDYGTKATFIAHHNETWSKHDNCAHLLLREEDFD